LSRSAQGWAGSQESGSEERKEQKMSIVRKGVNFLGITGIFYFGWLYIMITDFWHRSSVEVFMFIIVTVFYVIFLERLGRVTRKWF
jgi:hypothetical protein